MTPPGEPGQPGQAAGQFGKAAGQPNCWAAGRPAGQCAGQVAPMGVTPEQD